jgi:CRP/FNR family cyclic AMP-dependent transcriptional regulator
LVGVDVLLATLSPVPKGLLNHLPEAEQRAFLASGRRRRFRAKEVVFHEGDPGDSLHMVVSGRFVARSSTPLGEVAIVALFGPLDFFGEMALVDDSPRTATVAALGPGETMMLRREAFDLLRQTHPGTDRLLVEVLAERIRQTSVALLEALCERADVRVLRRLVTAAEFWGAMEAGGGSVALTQDELAGLAGTTRPTVSKVLAEASTAGLVRTGRGHIDILDPESLRRRAAVAV